MGRLEAQDLSRVQAMRAELATLVSGAPPALAGIVPELAELLGAPATFAFRPVPRGNAFALGFFHSPGAPGPVAFRNFERSLADPQTPWGYDPVRPERRQRNRVIGLEEMDGRNDATQKRFQREFRRWGVGDLDQIRVLVCEGPSLLTWIGAARAEPFGPRDRAILAAIVPALRTRLELERDLGEAPRMRSALAAALEALGEPAFIVDGCGRVRQANTAGRMLFDDDRIRMTSALRDAALRRPSAIAFRLTPLKGPGESLGFLAILDVAAGTLEARTSSRVSMAAARWGLTAQQTRILGLIARGLSTDAVAATLRIAVRTVEHHLTAIFDKAGAPGRSALVAMLLDMENRS